MDLQKVRPIIRHWKWLYDLLNYNQECICLEPEERFIERLKPIGMIIDELKVFSDDEHKWLLNIIKSKKLIILNDKGQRIKIIPEHFIDIISSDISDVIDTIKGKGIKKRSDKNGRKRIIL